MKLYSRKRIVTFFAAAVAMFVPSSSLAAQWLHYRNNQIPRTPDSKPKSQRRRREQPTVRFFVRVDLRQ